VLVASGAGPVSAWEEACRAAGVADPAGALERLSREGLVVVDGEVLRPAVR
jgi:hypothetical protein